MSIILRDKYCDLHLPRPPAPRAPVRVPLFCEQRLFEINYAGARIPSRTHFLGKPFLLFFSSRRDFCFPYSVISVPLLREHRVLRGAILTVRPRR